MKRSLFPIVFLISVSVLVLVSCDAGGETPTGGVLAERLSVPAEYAGKSNPLASDPAAPEAGSATFAANCSACHGEEAGGDGPAGKALDPAPGNLAVSQRELGDDYLYWRISEGGMFPPVNSVMPAWKNLLSEGQIWELVTFLRALDG